MAETHHLAWRIGLLLLALVLPRATAAQDTGVIESTTSPLGDLALHPGTGEETGISAQGAVVAPPHRSGSRQDSTAQAASRVGAEPDDSQDGLPRVSWRVRHPVAFGALVGSAFPLVGTGLGACVGHLASAKQKKYDAPVSGPPDVRSVKRLVALLGAGKQISAETTTGERIRGKIAGISGDMFSIVLEGQVTPVSVAYTSIQSMRGKPMSAGAKAGIVACTVGPVVGFALAAWGLSGIN